MGWGSGRSGSIRLLSGRIVPLFYRTRGARVESPLKVSLRGALGGVASQVPGRSMNRARDRAVLIELLEPSGAALDGEGDRGERATGFLDHLASVVDDAPAPLRVV